MAKLSNEYELYHHGILGQKWGIRRFQNKDGSYTAEGKERRTQSEERKIKIKKAIKIGAAVAATALVAYGAYKINQKKIPTSDELSRKIANGKKITEYYAKKMEAADRGHKKYDQLSNDYLQDKRMATLSGDREKAKKLEDKFWKASGKAKQFINISKKASDQLYKYGFELDEDEATKKYFSNNPYVVRRK